MPDDHYTFAYGPKRNLVSFIEWLIVHEIRMLWLSYNTTGRYNRRQHEYTVNRRSKLDDDGEAEVAEPYV